jgi:NAD(P)-dependent dehydrogenase (short-subunit alcohol dehydrogenase family)
MPMLQALSAQVRIRSRDYILWTIADDAVAMWDLIDEKLAEKSGAKKGEMIKKYTEDLTALGRTSVPEDVSKVVSFLSGPDSDFMTGQTVVVSTSLLLTE